MIGMVLLALLLASCRRFGGGEPTARPSSTPTPRSTPLPPVPTAMPVGETDNPLLMKFVVENSRAVASAIDELEQALLEETGLTVTVERVDSDAEALAALCDSPKGDVAVAWLSGLAYAAAYAQNCGTAQLQIQRGERANAITGDEARIIVTDDLEANTVGDLAETVFCRLGYDDLYSWLIPSLMLRSGGVTSTSLEVINDYGEDVETMVADVAAGDCDAAGISASLFEEVSTSTTRSAVRTLQESVTIPFAVLVYPGGLPLGARDALTNGLVAIGNGTRGTMLEPLLDQDEITAVTDEDLSSLRNFLDRAGIDLAQAGT
jgi:ABC-type phosphate/phosphonate transport system substrate-binding protein